MENKHTSIFRIAVTAGEPAGIGADILVQLAAEPFAAQLIAIGDIDLLKQRAKDLSLSIQCVPFSFSSPRKIHQSGILPVLHVPLKKASIPGQLDAANAAYVIETLTIAAENCLAKKIDAIVTAPVHKGIINDAGISFSGHTEFFAELTHTKNVVMMLVADKLRVALVTTHLPLKEVAKHITQEKIIHTVTILHTELKRLFGISNPQIWVAGLNPHAGESGHLGREEIDIIIPALEKLRAQHMQLVGPLPADTLFVSKHLEKADAVLAMYHDQGLPVLKYAGFGHAVNVTLGLPIIRTSVDHGTALELAGTGKADAGSLKAAIQMAIKLAACYNSNP